MNIFKQIKNSVYSKEYYQSTVLTESLSQSIKYLAKVCLLISLLAIVILTCLIPTMSNKIKSGMSSIIANYPEGLVVSINNGNASVNQPEPYFVKTPAFMLNTNNDTKTANFNNLITINTGESFNLDKFKEYSTLSLLTKKELIVLDGNNGGIKILPLAGMGNVEISKAWLLDKEAYFIKIMPELAIFMLVIAYVIIFILEFIMTLIALLFYALITWVILNAKGIKLSYKKYYQIALHASILLMLLGIVGNFLKPLGSVWIKIIVLGLIVYINFDKINNVDQKNVPLTPAPTGETML